MFRQRKQLFISGCVLCCFLMAGCSHKDAKQDMANSSSVIEQTPDGSVIQVARPDLFPLVKVEERKLPSVLTVPGVVAPDVNLTVHVYSLAGGRVTDVYTQLGDFVRKGQILLLVHSPDVATAVNSYLKAKADEQLSHAALIRAQMLYAHGALALKDLQVAQDNDQKASVDLATAVQQIHILGGDLQHLSPMIQVKAPISGTIIEQNITQGEAVKSVDNSPSLFTIADLSRIWILSNVYENDLSKVRLGDTAEIHLNAYPELVLHGRVDNISRVLDPATRTAAVRVVLGNPRGLLRPQMYATVKFISQALSSQLLVPTSALFRLHDKYWVFVPAGKDTFRRVPVEAGLVTPDGYQEILKGLDPSQEVVTNSLQFASSVEGQN